MITMASPRHVCVCHGRKGKIESHHGRKGNRRGYSTVFVLLLWLSCVSFFISSCKLCRWSIVIVLCVSVCEFAVLLFSRRI